jgi:hypothetical protein
MSTFLAGTKVEFQIRIRVEPSPAGLFDGGSSPLGDVCGIAQLVRSRAHFPVRPTIVIEPLSRNRGISRAADEIRRRAKGPAFGSRYPDRNELSQEPKT